MTIIYLIGFRGAGKTTLGKALAQKKNFYFLDCDEIFESQNGSILDFVKKNGKKSFREKEFLILKDMPEMAKKLVSCEEIAGTEKICLVATGGGFVDYAPSLEWMKEVPNKIFLHVPAEVIWDRIKENPARLQMGNICNYSDLLRIYQSRIVSYLSLNPKILPIGAAIEDDLKKLETIIQVEF